jgi:predicted outer membrane repeat protein
MNRINRRQNGQTLRRLFLIGLSILMLGITQVAQAGEHYPACNRGDKLISAIKNSNTNGEPDYIGLAGEGCVYKLDKTLYIEADGGHPITIEGNGAIISGSNKDNPFRLESGAALILQNVTLQEGNGYASGAVEVQPNASLTLTNTLLYGNRAEYGGAIYSGGNVTITNSTVQGNFAAERGGGIYQYDGNITVTNSFITLNESARGGGMWNQGGRLEIRNTLVSGNHASELGGGIYTSAITYVYNSLIQANRTDGDGGGIYTAGGRLDLTRSTLLENTARKGNGGGLFTNPNGTSLLFSSTVALNIADYGGGIHNDGKLDLYNTTVAYNTATTAVGGLLSTAGKNLLASTLLAFNQGGDCASSGEIIDDAGNWIGDASCIGGVRSGNPGLGALTAASEFAPRYYPLVPGSPAIDMGYSLFCQVFDQRNAGRPMDGNGDGYAVCDPGAYEADTVVLPTDVPTETATMEGPTETPDGSTATPTDPNSPTATATPTSVPVTPTAPAEEPGIELLANGDFEQKDTSSKSVLAPWNVKNGTSDKVKCNKPEKAFSRTGTCAFRFKGGASENAKLVQTVNLNTFTFAAGEVVELHSFINASSATVSGKVKLSVKYTDPALTPDKLPFELYPTNGYESFSGHLTLKSGSVAKIKLQINHRSPSGKVYVDSVSLKKLPPRVEGLLPLP